MRVHAFFQQLTLIIQIRIRDSQAQSILAGRLFAEACSPHIP